VSKRIYYIIIIKDIISAAVTVVIRFLEFQEGEHIDRQDTCCDSRATEANNPYQICVCTVT
jgi:hypothetical protein